MRVPPLADPAAAAPAPPPPAGKTAARRRKLWETDSRWHCGILGTCLTPGELRRIAAKARVRVAEGDADYHMHGGFVAAAGEGGLVARLVGKALDRKYASQVARFSKAKDSAAVVALWEDACRLGQVPGAYWALMTHPFASPALRERAHGEVHMMSHLAGAARRTDTRRTAELEREVAGLRKRIAELHRKATGYVARLTQSGDRVAATFAAERRAAELENRLAAHESGDVLAALRARLDKAEHHAAQADAHAEACKARVHAAERKLAALSAGNERLARDNAILQAALTPWPADQDGPPIDLSRRCLLYVGGVNAVVPRLQTLVRRLNGELLHHDGGIENGCQRLEGALCRADAVFCPVDCVSHDAVNRVKQACRKCGKPFVPLRGTGMAAFLRGLRHTELAAHPA